MEPVLNVFEGLSWSWLKELWQFQIVSLDGQPVTFGKLIIGILLFIIGYYLSKKVSLQIERNVLSRLHVDASMRHTLRTAIFYTLLVFLTLFVLRILNVPLTVFTVIGGALAIGVGFGSQNIVNNFISGLILMAERPVRVGDFIEADGIRGTVENIGARSTRIKSADNTHFVVPNSSFLEKNVLNWTLSDSIVRTKVVVGVAYGSPVRLVEKLLVEAASQHQCVLKNPPPFVLFADFADSSLTFELYFWTNLSFDVPLIVLRSDLRFLINDLFNDNDIVIAFPQQDIHLDATSPIKVEISSK